MDKKRHALTALGHILQSEKYRFAAVTPATHSRVLRHLQGPTTLQSIFGWNLPFDRDGVAPRILELLAEAEALDDTARLYRSKVPLRDARRFAVRPFRFSYDRAVFSLFRTGYLPLRAAASLIANAYVSGQTAQACRHR